MARGGGGYQQPSDPAPVSGAGADSRRTDGGPGSEHQPIRVASGGPYGQRKSLIDQQRAAPMAADTGLPEPQGGSPAGGIPAPLSAPTDPFGPSLRPGEPGNAGLNPASALTSVDILRMLWKARPSPVLAQILNKLGASGL